MKFFAIGDLHFSGLPPSKPMEIFGPHWANHRQRLLAHWQSVVTDDDVVFVVGDTSWAMRFNDAMEDLSAIAALPGTIYMIRGNHDYWWSSASKMQKATDHRITFLQGHGTAIGHIAFGGTRGYLCPNDTGFTPETDESIYARELLRTEAALQEMNAALVRNGTNEQEAIRILLLHYPPFNDKNEPSGFTDLLAKYKVDHCIFGHLHDKMSFARIPDTFGNTQLHLVSADYSQFKIQKIL